MRSGRALVYLASTAAIGLGVRSALRGHADPTVALAASTGFVSLLLAGVFEPRLGMFADTVLRGAPRPDAPRLALTFDDGPSPKSTPRVLDALDEAGAKGTFFVIGRKLEGDGLAIARDAIARGHELACHSHAHDRLFALRGRRRVREDLNRALGVLGDRLGLRPKWFRPPVLHTNPIIAEVAEELGLRIVAYSTRAYDGMARARADRVVSRVLAGASDGAIALLHDAAEREDFEPLAPSVLPAILAGVSAQNLRAVTLTDLLAETASTAPALDP